jgi:hypothetical protein
MKLHTDELGLLKYFPSVKFLISYVDGLEEDMKTLKEDHKKEVEELKAEVKELRGELRKERELGRDSVEKVVDKFTAPPPMSPADAYMMEYLKRPDESDEAYAKRMRELQPQASSFRGHNEILAAAYDSHKRVADKLQEQVAKEQATVVISAEKQRELVGKAKDIKGR